MNRPEPSSPTPVGVAHPRDVQLVKDVIARAPDALRIFAERMRCVPRMLAAKNSEMGRPLDDEQLADLAQDTLCAIWKRLPLYAGRGALETWTFRFCYFEFLRVLRDQRRIPQLLAEQENAITDAAEPSPSDSADYEQVLRCLGDIDADEAEVVRQKHFEEKTFDQIGALLSISPNTAKTRYYRGIMRLRQKLSPTTMSSREERGQ